MNGPARPFAVILAGGESKRMGAAKACADLDGKPLLLHVADAFKTAGLEPVVVAKRTSNLPASDLQVITEPDIPIHPLAGIVCALRKANGADVLVCPCDMPLVTPELLAFLADTEPGSEAVVPVWRGRLQPLSARYSPSSLPALEQALDNSMSVKAALARIDVSLIAGDQLKKFGDPDRYLEDADDPAALAALQFRQPQ